MKYIKNVNNDKFKFLIIAVVLLVIVKLIVFNVGDDNNIVDTDKNLAVAIGNNVKIIAERGNVVSNVEIKKVDKDDRGKLGKEFVVKEEDIAKIAIVIDDLGINRDKTLDVLDIDVPMTLAFLPYAPHLDEYVKKAKEKGQDVIIHVPMEPLGDKADPGPVYLSGDMNDEEFVKAIDVIFGSFEGYVGINNHMGSKATQDKKLMKKLMKILKEKNIYFLDSKTIKNSVAAETASEYGVKNLSRDVFLDHEENIKFVENSFDKVSRIALDKGVAIAIGHPKENTINVLIKWVEKAKTSGKYKFVKLSDLL